MVKEIPKINFLLSRQKVANHEATAGYFACNLSDTRW